MSSSLELMSIFPSPIGVCNFGEESRELNKSLIQDIETERKTSENKKRTFSTIDGAWQSDFNLDIKYESFNILRENLLKVLLNILPQVGYTQQNLEEKLNFGGFWGNVVYKKGGFSVPHIHGNGNTLWTGVYYPKGIDKQNNLDDFNISDIMIAKNHGYAVGGGWLGLIDPARIQKSQCILAETEQYPFYGASIYIKPREGLLILFPSWLEHWVTPTINNDKRYSISFRLGKRN